MIDRPPQHASTPPVLSQTLNEAQEVLGLNKSALARIFGVSRPTIYAWLQGVRPDVTPADRLDALNRLISYVTARGEQLSPIQVRKHTPAGVLEALLTEEAPLTCQAEACVAYLIGLQRRPQRPRISAQRAEHGMSVLDEDTTKSNLLHNLDAIDG